MARISSADIPNEIWLHILRYVPEDQVKSMINLNSLFFNVAMDLRWKEVLIATKYPSKAMRMYGRLSEPSIGSRVQRLKIELSKEPEEEPLRPLPTLSSKLKDNNWLKVSRGKKQKDRDKDTPPPSPVAPPSPFPETLDWLITTMSTMDNVRDLSIEAWSRPGRQQWDVGVLFSSIWSSFGPKLDRLSVDSDAECLRILIAEAAPKFDHLQELQISLLNNTDLENNNKTRDENTLLNTVVPFIQSVAPQLEVLTLACFAAYTASTAYTPFFEALTNTDFHLLKSCSLDFRHPSIPSPTSVKNFLRRRSDTLRKLGLKIRLLNDYGEPSEAPLSSWLNACLGTEDVIHFPHLLELDITPTHMDAGRKVLLTYIRSTASTVRYLTIRDSYFSLNEAKEVLEAASTSGKLTYLSMSVATLEFVLFDYIWFYLPELQELRLSVKTMADTPQCRFIRFDRDKAYPDSKVKDLSLFWKDGLALDAKVMHSVARGIPSIHSFFGLGHMQVERLSGRIPPQPPRRF